MPLPRTSAAPAGSVRLNACDDPLGLLGGTKRDENLVQNHLVQDREPRRTQSLREEFGLMTIALDQFSQSAASQGTHRGPEFDASGATRGIGCVLPRFSSCPL